MIEIISLTVTDIRSISNLQYTSDLSRGRMTSNVIDVLNCRLQQCCSQGQRPPFVVGAVEVNYNVQSTINRRGFIRGYKVTCIVCYNTALNAT